MRNSLKKRTISPCQLGNFQLYGQKSFPIQNWLERSRYFYSVFLFYILRAYLIKIFSENSPAALKIDTKFKIQ